MDVGLRWKNNNNSCTFQACASSDCQDLTFFSPPPFTLALCIPERWTLKDADFFQFPSGITCACQQRCSRRAGCLFIEQPRFLALVCILVLLGPLRDSVTNGLGPCCFSRIFPSMAQTLNKLIPL